MLVEDEDLVLLEPPDGGIAWFHGAMRGIGRDDRVHSVVVDVDRLTEGVARCIFEYISRASFVLARWPNISTDRRGDVREGVLGSRSSAPHAVSATPEAVFVAAASLAEGIPATWPRPRVCADADGLFRCLE